MIQKLQEPLLLVLQSGSAGELKECSKKLGAQRLQTSTCVLRDWVTGSLAAKRVLPLQPLPQASSQPEGAACSPVARDAPRRAACSPVARVTLLRTAKQIYLRPSQIRSPALGM